MPLIPEGDGLPLTPEGSSPPAETAPPSNEEALPGTPEAAPDGNFENFLEDPLSPAPENEPLPDLSNPE
ncbi:MAG: hypothetical protein HC890_11410 [Chloroflexaceae bacterium]|nr:hypothetical protein [Chloroflexaceae bacterium]